MSGNTEPKPSRTDARVRRTRDTLGDALVQLMREQPFDSITVQHVLDRAGVSRSTFYTHYSDKDDLFLSDLEDFFDALANHLTRSNAAPGRLVPVQELFAHLIDFRDFHDALVASGKFAEVRDLGLGYFARSIEQRFVLAGVVLPSVELRVVSHALAGAVFSLLQWWMSHCKAASPAEMDALFHRMAWNGVAITPPRA